MPYLPNSQGPDLLEGSLPVVCYLTFSETSYPMGPVRFSACGNPVLNGKSLFNANYKSYFFTARFNLVRGYKAFTELPEQVILKMSRFLFYGPE